MRQHTIDPLQPNLAAAQDDRRDMSAVDLSCAALDTDDFTVARRRT
jgi:hypothetical protein